MEQRKNGNAVRTASPFAVGPAYVLSAQPGVAAAAVGNRAAGFQLSLVTHQGRSRIRRLDAVAGLRGKVTGSQAGHLSFLVYT